MIEVGWNKFRAKFEGREDEAFELLCYLLFLREHDLPEKGLFGYYNQIGIETEPVKIDDVWVGFQAKYSDSKVSTTAIKDSLSKAKGKHPDLQKVIVFTNTEFSETRKNTSLPEAQLDVENFASGLGLRIEWRVKSNFTALLSQEKNQDLAEHFFSPDPGRYEFIRELKLHTQEILKPIRTSIEFGETIIKLDRSVTLSLNDTAKPKGVSIIHGPGGVGKTALIRDLFETLEEKDPLFVFKASEFNVRHINDLFQPYGRRSLDYFIEVFAKAEKKVFVVDSAEKLSDLDDHDAFRELLTRLTENGWTVLLTTRDLYLDSLEFQLLSVYRQAFEKFRLTILDEDELSTLATENGFTLPSSERLRDLIRNPFYLAEYLRLSSIGDSHTTLIDFKNTLWKKKILGSSSKDAIDRRREDSFIGAIRHRADTGGFAMPGSGGDPRALRALEVDEVLAFDKVLGGYFITHDIYEEWGLATIIERSFVRRSSTGEFFETIGGSLPMRRAFRQWLSEALEERRDSVRAFVEDSIGDAELAQHWKDEVLSSVLRSDYSAAFFEMFERQLLSNDCQLLVRLMFLLRIGCKEADTEQISRVREFSKDASPNLLITKPIGSGWSVVIEYIHKHIEDIPSNLNTVVTSVLEEWAFANKLGTATRSAGLIALRYYESAIADDRYDQNEMIERLVAVICNCAAEIKAEMGSIFDEVINQGAVSHRQQHIKLIKSLLSDAITGYQVASILPAKTMKMAEIYWLRSAEGRYDDHLGIERYFDIEFGMGHEYFPASAFQTPMFALFRSAPIESFRFLHAINEKTIGHYVKTDLDSEVEQMEVNVDGAIVTQHVNARIWNMYRATQTAPYLLASLHMALERYLLEIAAIESAEVMVAICKRLLLDSKFASITAVVASVVLSQPDKLFEVAKILFKSRSIVIHDSERKVHEASARRLYSIPSTRFLPDVKLHVDERLATCDQPHRQWSLEELARNYQFFAYSNDSQVSEKRQQELWEIFDEHYAKLPPEKDQSDNDRVWRMALARMDRRKMAASVEKEENGDRLVISFNPEIGPDLQSFREESSTMLEKFTKFIPLKLWAMAKFENRVTDSPYDTNPSSALSEVREIVDMIEKTEDPNEPFWLFNGSTPTYVSAVLLRDHVESLSGDDCDFCASVLLDAALIPHRREGYFYQIMDGVEPAITSLATVFDKVPQYADEAKQCLVLSLLNQEYEVSTFAKRSVLVNGFWNSKPNDAQSLLIGFILLKSRYDGIAQELWREKHRVPAPHSALSPESTLNTLAQRFIEDCEADVERVLKNEVVIGELDDLEKYPIAVIASAIELVPLATDDPFHAKLISTIAVALAEPDTFEEANEQSGFTLQFRTLQKFANLVISSPPKHSVEFVRPFTEHFDAPVIPDLLKQLIFAEDQQKQYESFWAVWQSFYPAVVEYTKVERWGDHPNPVLHNYLLGGELWNEDAKEWPSLKDREKLFFQRATRELGQHPSAFFAIARFLNEVGSPFLSDGVVWISDLLNAGETKATQNPESGTVYYLETLVRHYSELQRRSIRRSLETRNRVIRLLDYLVENGSVNAFLLRDQLA